MNSADLEEAALERLKRESRIDPMRWVPVVGSADSHSKAFGLAIELLGAEPARREMEKLIRVLFHLTRFGSVEVAQFKTGPARGGSFGGRPTRQDDQTYLAFATDNTASRFARYGVRLGRQV